ncbi:DUF2894 domain-containing protein [Variovorax dokdonensis]|uniref:DUF2894 domain-containing protein n=1 Tax=Variovorax dokdonensis TaxID=344883 RepID=A0ABT7NDN7_9BURK|nr:DUF2894 domain-containing protein [Variovorax dokdonensis]
MAEQDVSEGTATTVPQHDALVTLRVWQERGARRVDPLRFDFLQALARRTAACEGAARPLLDDKLGQAMSRYREACEQAGCVLDGDAPDQQPPPSARRANAAPAAPGALAQLLAQVDVSRQGGVASAASAAQVIASGSAKRPSGQVGQAGQVAPASPEPRPGQAQEALTYFRRTWTRLDARRRLAQSQASLPANAGPLNSQQLVHRALTLMQGAAPGYLHQLMSYVDALSALEPFQPAAVAAAAAAAAAPTEAARGNGPVRKTGRTKR